MTQAVDRLWMTPQLHESSNCVDTDRSLSPLFRAAISKYQTSHCPNTQIKKGLLLSLLVKLFFQIGEYLAKLHATT